MVEKANQIQMNNTAQHIIPVGGEEPVHHASWGCWCHPMHKDGLIVHNAKDARERYERQNMTNPDLKWVTVKGPIEGESAMIQRLRRVAEISHKKQVAAERLADELKQQIDQLDDERLSWKREAELRGEAIAKLRAMQKEDEQ